MEEASPQDVEYKNPNDDQGGTRRRLRDRDLLRKKKAEAEEKETNQWDLGMERPRKRSRADKSSSKKQGRPRKSEEAPLMTFIEEAAAAVATEAPAVVVVPKPAEVILDQTPNTSLTSLTEAESAPVIKSIQRPIFAPFQSPANAPIITFPAPANPVLDSAPIQNPAPDPSPDVVSGRALSQDSVSAPPPAPLQVETLFKKSQGKEALDQILIEDLGPDEEEDQGDVSEPLTINTTEQTKIYSVSTFSSPPLPQEYFPGN